MRPQKHESDVRISGVGINQPAESAPRPSGPLSRYIQPEGCNPQGDDKSFHAKEKGLDLEDPSIWLEPFMPKEEPPLTHLELFKRMAKVYIHDDYATDEEEQVIYEIFPDLKGKTHGQE